MIRMSKRFLPSQDVERISVLDSPSFFTSHTSQFFFLLRHIPSLEYRSAPHIFLEKYKRNNSELSREAPADAIRLFEIREKRV
jgi:hypothetical protein